MSYQRDLLYSGGSARSVTLAQPASGYSRIVQVGGPSGYAPNTEYVVTANCNNFLINRGYSVYSTTMYPVWPYRVSITNNTKSLSGVNFQLLQQGGSAAPSTFGWNNTAGNIKWLGVGNIYGEQPVSGITATGLGSPGVGWREYDETLLYSASAAAPNPGTITLSEPVTAFSRLKIALGIPNAEGCTVMEVGTPVNSAAYIPLESFWGNSTASFVWSLHRYRMSGWSAITPVSGKAFQLGTGAANPYAATGNYTSTEAYIRRPITMVWGINRKYPMTLTVEFLRLPSLTTKLLNNSFITTDLTMYYKDSADGEWLEMGNEQKVALLGSGVTIPLYGFKVVDIPDWESTTIMNEADYMAQQSEFQAKVTIADTKGNTFLDATSEVGRYAVYAYIQENFSCTFSAF